ncbi:MAG: isoprenylcysteine carboxylmethyltransferase family protein [Hyphomicrobiaceae bacterium]
MIAYALFRHRDLSDTQLSIVVVLVVAGVLSTVEYARVNQGIDHPKQCLKVIAERALSQWLDSMLGLALVVLFWWLLDAEYGRSEYKPLREALPLVLPFTAPVVLIATLLAAWRLGPIREGPTPLATFLLSLGRDRRTSELQQAVLALLVRAIFLPLNFCVFVHCISHIRGREAYLLTAAWPGLHAEILTVIYALLIATIIPGYLFSSRLLGTQVRRIDTTILGWAATLACYRPLSLAVFERWLNYHGSSAIPGADRPWVTVTGNWPSILLTVGTAIIALEFVHLWAEASFGLRASNLSNRGIITHGPYKWCKHPIYLSKCLGWILIYLPFASATVSESIRATLLFAGVCGLYAVRSYAEERLLASDPDYVEYALWMDGHGLFSWVSRLFHGLSFRARLARWQGDATVAAHDTCSG